MQVESSRKTMNATLMSNREEIGQQWPWWPTVEGSSSHTKRPMPSTKSRSAQRSSFIGRSVSSDRCNPPRAQEQMQPRA
jgi:hypothetical protein